MDQSTVQAAQAAAVVIGFVNGARLLKDQNYWGVIFWALALVTGLILGLVKFYGLTPETGLALGIGSSGLYRLGEKFGGH